jgi:uncharacterized protein YeaO (DUF488 family)
MIRHASVYDRDGPSEDEGFRVLIMRYWPRGVRRDRVDLWLKDAAPSQELLQAYSHEGLRRKDFERRYRSEILHDRPHVLDELRRLERAHGAITLLCHERIPPAEHCHREILAELLRSRARQRRRAG